jgi:YVTN family beta-propeller protein
VTNRTDSTISRIDPHTNQVVKTIKLGGTPEESQPTTTPFGSPSADLRRREAELN